jgi:hypothetical protein
MMLLALRDEFQKIYRVVGSLLTAWRMSCANEGELAHRKSPANMTADNATIIVCLPDNTSHATTQEHGLAPSQSAIICSLLWRVVLCEVLTFSPGGFP